MRRVGTTRLLATCPLDDLAEELDAAARALLGMELHAEHVVALHRRHERVAVRRGREHVVGSSGDHVERVDEVEVGSRAGCRRRAATRPSGVTSFQPMCGTRRSSSVAHEARRDRLDQPRPSASGRPSSPIAAISCMPRHTPRNGAPSSSTCLAARRRDRDARRCCIAAAKRADAGQHDAVGRVEIAGVVGDVRGGAPTSSNARLTESRLHIP